MKHSYPLCLSTAVASLFLVVELLAQVSFPLVATGYDSHAELQWSVPAGVTPAGYRVYRSSDGIYFESLGLTTKTGWIDFSGFPGEGNSITYYYKVSALDGSQLELASSSVAQATIAPLSDSALLDMVQRYTFRYFWDFAHPVSGLARERNTSGEIVTIGGSGFGIMAILVAAHRGWITREQARDQLLKIVGFLQFADRYHGVFPHWMDGSTGNAIPFSQYDDGGDLVETAFLMQGLLAARQYFDLDDPYEEALRQAITGLWEDVEWDWYSRNDSGVLYWHWSPNYGWQMNFPIRGFNEAMIVYILAIASPTHPVPASYWNTGWTAQNYYHGLLYYGYPLATGPTRGGPLFFAHYSFLGFDPRNKKDFFANYFIRNRNHTLINRAWCIENPLGHAGYSENSWGLTASDDPWGYLAHEPMPGRDNGTIAPTAALSSMPYTPAESMAALKHFYRNLGDRLWGPMGFYDAFNIGQNWFANSYLAIDQGTIIGMIENHRSGLLWELFMANPEIPPALDAIGFVEDPTSATYAIPTGGASVLIVPNPAKLGAVVLFNLEKGGEVFMDLFDARGQRLLRILRGAVLGAGDHQYTIDTSGLLPGSYTVLLTCGTATTAARFVITP